MNTITRAIRTRWTRRATSLAGAAVRLCLALWLILQIVGTPIHVHLEPHWDGPDLASNHASTPVAPSLGDDGHDDGGHERHAAAQHDLKALRSARSATALIFVAPAVPCLDVAPDRPQPRVFEFSGHSPPELPRSWQFLFRAALPVRAPSFLS